MNGQRYIISLLTDQAKDMAKRIIKENIIIITCIGFKYN